jgi:hypothetical protein
LHVGEYCSNDEFEAADGAFEGNGRFCCSYKNPGNDEVKKMLSLTWCEVRAGVENSYQRVTAWFPLLRNNKIINYLEHMLILAVQAACTFLS